METESLSRAEESRLARAARDPRSGLGLDAEHGSGTADPEGLEFGCGNPIDREGRPGRAQDRKSRSAKAGLRDHAWRHFAARPQDLNRLPPDFPPRPLTTLAPRNWGFTGRSPFSAMYYNFVRIHKSLRTTPAMAAGVTMRLWEIGDIVEMLEAWEVN